MSDVVPAESRLVRTCDACGQTDDHPHHVMYGAVSFQDPVTGQLVNEDRSRSRHIDCCAAGGCGHCAIVLQHSEGKFGLELAQHIQSKPAALHTALRESGFDVAD